MLFRQYPYDFFYIAYGALFNSTYNCNTLPLVFLNHLGKENLKNIAVAKMRAGYKFGQNQPSLWARVRDTIGVSRCQIFYPYQSTEKIMLNNRTIAVFSRKKYHTDLNFFAAYERFPNYYASIRSVKFHEFIFKFRTRSEIINRT